MSFDQWEASISEPSTDTEFEDFDIDEEDFIEVEVESESTPEESFEVAEDYEFEVTDFADIQMALDYFEDSWTRMDLDNPDGYYNGGAQTEFNFNRFPESGLGIMFSTAELTENDVTMEVSVVDEDHIMYTEPYFADGI